MTSKTHKLSRVTLANLLHYVTGKPFSKCLSDPKIEVSFEEYALMSRYLKLLQKQVPLAYVLGFREFFSRKFWVNSSVLIPRQESELLVEVAVDSIVNDQMFKKKKIQILELGTGSGAVIISIVLELLKHGIRVNAHATDICPKALSVAKNNASWLDANISFFKGNWFDFYKKSWSKYDLVIANPPYIGLDHDEYISKKNLSFEPKLALYGSKPSTDGMRDYQHIIDGLSNKTNNQALLIIEHGSMQIKQIKNLLKLKKLTNFKEIRDFYGLPRLVKVRL